MEYNKIISVTGLPGLYELVSSRNDGALVRSLDDQSTKFVSSRVHNFSHLESIEVYTEDDNVNLAEVFKAMGESSEKKPEEKDAAAVRAYFEKVFPSMDVARVYNSDMKKMIRWYAILEKNKIEIKLSEPVEEAAAEEEVKTETEKTKKTAKPKAAKEEATEVAPAPKTKSKKASGETEQEEPVKAKKTAAKKK
jgi:hypothetical protein